VYLREQLVVGISTVAVVLDLHLQLVLADIALQEGGAEIEQGEQHLTRVRGLYDLGDVGVPILVRLQQLLPLIDLLGKGEQSGQRRSVAVRHV